jgi:hypothetical protein
MKKISLSLLTLLMAFAQSAINYEKEALYQVLTQQSDGGANIRFLKF